MNDKDWCTVTYPDCTVEYTKLHCKKYCGLCGTRVNGTWEKGKFKKNVGLVHLYKERKMYIFGGK